MNATRCVMCHCSLGTANVGNMCVICEASPVVQLDKLRKALAASEIERLDAQSRLLNLEKVVLAAVQKMATAQAERDEARAHVSHIAVAIGAYTESDIEIVPYAVDEIVRVGECLRNRAEQAEAEVMRLREELRQSENDYSQDTFALQESVREAREVALREAAAVCEALERRYAELANTLGPDELERGRTGAASGAFGVAAMRILSLLDAAPAAKGSDHG